MKLVVADAHTGLRAAAGRVFSVTLQRCRVHWTQISFTNPIERVNREIKRRCDVIGIFPNDAAIIHLVGALMLEQNDEWAVCRRYMTLEGLTAISHNQTSSLPTVAA